MEDFAIKAIFVIAIGFFAFAGAWYYVSRAGMTKEQRAEDDAENNYERIIW